MRRWAMLWRCLSLVNLSSVSIASLLVMKEHTTAMCLVHHQASTGAVTQWQQCMTWQILHHCHVHFPLALIKRRKIYRSIESIIRKLSTLLNFDSFQRKEECVSESVRVHLKKTNCSLVCLPCPKSTGNWRMSHWKYNKKRNLVEQLKQQKCSLVIRTGAGLRGGLSGNGFICGFTTAFLCAWPGTAGPDSVSTSGHTLGAKLQDCSQGTGSRT